MAISSVTCPRGFSTGPRELSITGRDGDVTTGGMLIAIALSPVPELPAPLTDGAGGTTCRPVLDRELARQPPVELIAFSSDGAGETTVRRVLGRKLTRPPPA